MTLAPSPSLGRFRSYQFTRYDRANVVMQSKRGFCARNLLFLDSFTKAFRKQQIPPCRSATRRNDKGDGIVFLSTSTIFVHNMPPIGGFHGKSPIGRNSRWAGVVYVGWFVPHGDRSG